MGWLPGGLVECWVSCAVGSWFIHHAAEDVAQRQSQNSSTGEQITCYSSGIDFQAETAPALSRKARSNAVKCLNYDFCPPPKPILWRPTLLPCSTPDPPGLVVARPNRLILPQDTRSFTSYLLPPLPKYLTHSADAKFVIFRESSRSPSTNIVLEQHLRQLTLITNAFPSFSAPSAPSNIWYRSQFRVIT